MDGKHWSQSAKAAVAAVAVVALTALLTVAGVLVAPRAAAAEPVVSNVQIEAAKAEAWARVTITADWQVESPASGDALTISLGSGLYWPAGAGFGLTEETTGETVAGCSFVQGSPDLTCVFNAEAEQFDRLITGSLTANAAIHSSAIGSTSAVVVVAGATYSVGFGGTVVGEAVTHRTYKSGWSAGTVDGGYAFLWDVQVTGSTEYTVEDPTATTTRVLCATDDWTKAELTEYVYADGVTIFEAPSAGHVCRVRLSSTSTEPTQMNTATVNGKTYTYTATLSAAGSGSGTGEQNPSEEPTTLASTGADGVTAGVAGALAAAMIGGALVALALFQKRR